MPDSIMQHAVAGVPVRLKLGAGAIVRRSDALRNAALLPGLVWAVLIVSLVTAGVFIAIVSFAIRSLRSPVRTGQESLTGMMGYARSELKPKGTVHVNGEEWSAELPDETQTVAKGARIQIVRVEGIRLIVQAEQE